MIKAVFYGWKIDKEAEKLMERMSAALKTLIKSDASIQPEIIDVAAYGEIDHREGWGFAFGRAIKQVTDCNGQLIGMPDAELLLPGDSNHSHREGALEHLKSVAEFIDNKGQEEEVPTNVAVLKDGISVGQDNADIVIPEGTLRYIEQIRDLLGGGAIEITKGDLKIEIKEKEDGEG